MYTSNGLFLILLAVLVAAIACTLYRMLKQFSVVQLHRDQRGASYSLSMILTLPFYLAILVGAMEANWMFRANVQFQRAALMAGRSISLTYQDEYEEQENDAELKNALEQNGKLATALVMFSNGSGIEDHAIEINPEESKFIQRFLEQLEQVSEFTPNSDTRLRAEYSAGATKVTISNALEPSDISMDKLLVAIEYEHPFFSQVIGRFFGQLSSKSGDFYVRKFSKEFEIPLEVARSEDRTMGINNQSAK